MEKKIEILEVEAKEVPEEQIQALNENVELQDTYNEDDMRIEGNVIYDCEVSDNELHT